jgi:hypothetical protein
LIRAGVRTDSMIGVTNLELKNGKAGSSAWIQLHPIIPCPPGRFF